MTGYLHESYAQSLAEFGLPRHLSQSGGWILERYIPGVADRDAMACYPLLCCNDWSLLQNDLDNIGEDLVSLSIVTDPFGNYDEDLLRQCFRDKVIPFKQHFIIDLMLPVDEYISYHHRRNVRQSQAILKVEICQEPLLYLNDWVELYDYLIGQYQITGIRKFSTASFREQFQTPGVTVFRAQEGEATVGMAMWFQHENIGYYHLAAYNEVGYERKASFALFQHAIEHFTQIGLRYLNLGAGAGVQAGKIDGLTRFKSGWATGTKTAYFCGRIFNSNRYEEIQQTKNIVTGDYFPTYRQGEFN